MTVWESKEATLRCTFTDGGVPLATFTWMKDGVVLASGDTTGVYVITYSTVEQDDGIYQCLPTNKVGDGEAATISLMVKSKYTVLNN